MERNVRLAHIFACMMVTTVFGYVNCDRVKKLERLVMTLAGNLQLESASRNVDMENILERLRSIEMAVNGSAETPAQYNTKQPNDTSTTFDGDNGVARLTKAFEEEKDSTERLRRQVTEITERYGALHEYVGNMLETVDAIKSDMCTLSETNTILETSKSALNEGFKEVQIVVKTLEKEMKIVSNDLQKARDEFQSRSDTVENKLSSILLFVKNLLSCLDYYNSGHRKDGVYTLITKTAAKPFEVYCDMTTDGGGWTVFQRRKDGSVDFFRGWQDYKQGFGDPRGEFWLGNDHISALAGTCCHELRIELGDFENNTRFAKYGKFQVLTESENYKLLVDEYSGDAGDSMKNHNGQQFSTKDLDNDAALNVSCAKLYTGAWWYSRCHASNLNGLYLKGAGTAMGKGINWYYWKTNEYSLKMTEMKFR